MELDTRDTVAITDLGAYKRNLKKIQEYIGTSVRLMAVVKANAYGHGMVECARTALDAGSSMLGVALVSEGILLRKAGIEAPILVLVPESSCSPSFYCEHNLTMTLTSLDMFDTVHSFIAENKAALTVHINVDTGMGRIGAAPGDAVELVERAHKIPGMTIEGIYSHFPSSDEDMDDLSRVQIERFENLLDALSRKGIRPPLAHLCNSAGTLKFPEAHFDMVRPGIMTYGLIPYTGSSEILEFEPVLSLTSKVGFVKEVPSGTAVSYGGTFVTGRKSKLATVPVGYGDGFNRSLSNRGRALIKGKSVPVAGRVCMDQTVFNVTDAGDVHVGDTITLIGKDGNERINVEEHAEIAETITHEIATGITGRVSRYFIPAS